ncbi:MAG: cation:proton antiporter [Bacteroidota bacterium]|nr:cation:proton antiporter [Bacteroidota bacterium]
MPQFDILGELILILAAILLVIPVFKRINIPPLVGFLLAGVVIGPHGIKLIQRIEVVQILAEIGVVLLLFTIGLEFSLARLKRIKSIVLIGGGLQVTVTIIIVTAAVAMFGLPIREAIFMGFLVSLSSTAIVMKLLSDRNETDTAQGKISLGILLFQDLCIVPMMLLVPVLSASKGTTFYEVIIRLIIAFITVGIIFIAARYVMPKFIELLIKIRSREMFVIGVVFISLGTALATSYAGLSLALGAFVAGLILSESEYSHEIVGAALPFRDALSSLFFISIGMLLNLEFVLSSILYVVGAAASVIVLKFIVIAFVVLHLSFPTRTAIIVGFSMVQIGEFSFILALAGRSAGIMNDFTYQMFLAASIVTMMLTPLLVKYSSDAAEILQRFLPARLASNAMNKLVNKEIGLETKNVRLISHVIIIGYGLNGKNLVTVLKETGIPYIIADLNGEVVKAAKNLGENIVYGDATRQDILTHLGIENSRVMVVAISDPDSTRRILRNAKSLNPDIHIIVRTRSVLEIEDLYKLGADQVIPEEYETSIEIFTRVLRHYHLPRNIIAAQVGLIRREGYGMFRGLQLPDATMDQLAAILAAGTTDTYLVLNESPACGKSLSELDLRNRTGASIIAIVRENQPFTNPRANFKFQSGDVIVMLGTHAEIDNAFELLNPPRLEID